MTVFDYKKPFLVLLVILRFVGCMMDLCGFSGEKLVIFSTSLTNENLTITGSEETFDSQTIFWVKNLREN